jgi:hypothetical protein
VCASPVLAARIFAAGEIVLLLGWGVAQAPYRASPDLKLVEVAAPAPTIRFLLISLAVGAALLVPWLWYLFKIFKSAPVSAAGDDAAA